MSIWESMGIGKKKEEIIKPNTGTVEKTVRDGGHITLEQEKIDQQKEAVMKRIENDAKLKKAYEFWFNKTDKTTGKNMQDKLVEFLMENPKVDNLGYNRITKEFVNAKMAGASSVVA